MQFRVPKIPVVVIENSLFEKCKIRMLIQREDLIHEHISGNKWRKLKYNLLEAKKSGKTGLLTYGGAYSNHIAAVASAGKQFGFKTIGIIRGEAHYPLNPTLEFAKKCGMKLEYVQRTKYKELKDGMIETQKSVNEYFVIPEGGANELGVKGCEEILHGINDDFDVVCCSCGTGATLAGVLRVLKDEQSAIGFSSLKGGDYLRGGIREYAEVDNFEIITNYHFGGYAKIDDNLVRFVRDFNRVYGIPLDLVYTGKMMFGIFDLVQQGYFTEGTTILVIHTGGLQGNKGFEQRFGISLG